MSFNRYKPWADDVVDQEDENGPKVETDATFDDTKIGAGCTKQRFPYPTFNRVMNRADNQIQSILGDGIAMGEDGIDTEILEGRMSSACATSHGLSAANQYNIGSSTTCFSRIWPTKIAGVQKCLAIDANIGVASIKTMFLYVIDAAFGTVETIDLSSGFSLSGNMTLRGICADGIYCYVTAMSDDGYAQQIQAFEMTTWNVRNGWSAGGTEIGNSYEMLHPDCLIIANSTYLALLQYRAGIYFINRSNGDVLKIDDISNFYGDQPLPHTRVNYSGICSNGTYLFYGATAGLYSISIADPTIGCGGISWPYTTSGTIHSIACRGDLVAVCHGGTSAIVEVARVQNANYATITVTGDTPYVHGVAFDDTSLWMRISRLCGSTRRQSLVQIGLQAPLPENSSSAAALSVDSNSTSARCFEADLVHPTAPDGMDMRWDGRDLWIPGEATATSTALNPYIFRYPHTRNNRGINY
jgi:hypothetical protein